MAKNSFHDWKVESLQSCSAATDEFVDFQFTRLRGAAARQANYDRRSKRGVA